MAKTIVFCADGTWNGPGQDENNDGIADATNVLRLFDALSGRNDVKSLRLENEQEKALQADDGAVLQVAKYIHGVGDSKNIIKKLLGGVFGEGFIERIVRGYTFVSRNYQPGDHIHLAGFSRGAYTARALGGMISTMGLLAPSAMRLRDGTYDAETAYRSGAAAWACYRQRGGKPTTLLSYLQEFRLGTRRCPDLIADVGMRSIAAWDTVGALGIPVFDAKTRDRIDVFQFADADLSPKVDFGFHAVAIDEQRGDFIPTWWNPRQGVEQALFVGAHADVGGGYPETALSCHSLHWMKRRLAALGVQFDDLAGPVEGPHIPINTPWTKPPFSKLRKGPRSHPDHARIHRSVQRRVAGMADYQPTGLPLTPARLFDGARLVD